MTGSRPDDKPEPDELSEAAELRRLQSQRGRFSDDLVGLADEFRKKVAAIDALELAYYTAPDQTDDLRHAIERVEDLMEQTTSHGSAPIHIDIPPL